MNRAWLGWAGLLVWAGSLSAGMLLYSQQQLSLFDPDMALSQAAASTAFDNHFVSLLASEGVTAGSIVHFQRDTRCYCDTLTGPHQRQLSNRLDEQGYQLTVLNPDDSPGLAAVITRTPAVAIVDHNSQLKYLGPYATGYGCFTGNTLVDTISRYASDVTLPGAVITTDAKGCFCHA